MSCDFAVWYPHQRLSTKAAREFYTRLCEGDAGGVRANAAVDAFYEELTSIHPEIDAGPNDETESGGDGPWSCALDRSPGHVIVPCVWSKGDYVTMLVHDLARKHGLAVYDPQSDRITYPDGDPAAEDNTHPWWRFW